MVTFRQTGNFKHLSGFLEKMKEGIGKGLLDKYGQLGVEALSHATPIDSGKTAALWFYSITQEPGRATLSFHNSNINDGIPIAIVLQYGHATRNGGWVEGRDYINPALRPVMEQLAEEAWREVRSGVH